MRTGDLADGVPSLPEPNGATPWQVIDDAWTHLDRKRDMPHRWLWTQTMATSVMRRHILTLLGVQPGWRTLDIGTGFGPIPMELAALAPIEATGIDTDTAVLREADRVRAEVESRGGFHIESQVNFAAGDAYELVQDNQSTDLVTARFVLQHLRDPSAAVSEMARVVRPGGLVCVIDVDDGLSVTYPEPSAAFRLLADAVSAMQTIHGGDRDIGRKLPSMLDRGGFDVRAVLALPDAGYRTSKPGDLDRRLLVDRFRTAKAVLIEGEFLTPGEFDDALAEFSSEIRAAECVVVTHLAAIGHRR
jgi:ubiquinone/menaquinone biosynthesis C-methylase UbiE